MSIQKKHTDLDQTRPEPCRDVNGARASEMAEDQLLIFERGQAGRRGVSLPPLPAGADPRAHLPGEYLRTRPAILPEVSELQAVRHYTRLSQKNYSIDTNFYPLGSCTMKYNPKACEAAAAMPEFTGLHPLQDARDAQGTLSILYELQELLGEIVGLPHVSLTPVAGAQGELAGALMIHAWHRERETGRDTILVPDSAHGTNPASATLAGFKVRTVKSGKDGRLDPAALRAELDEKTAALMLTNPNTCGLFEKDILEIAQHVHEAGALLYYDGANLNAIVGRARPGDMGFDVVHLNLHKTFSTPHGGGGPGAGPIAVREDLAPYLPQPLVLKGDDGLCALEQNNGRSIGRLHAFAGNIGVLIRAYLFIRMQGSKGLRAISTHSVLNANYLLARLGKSYEAPYGGPCMHEFVLSLRSEARKLGIKAFDVSKRLLDYGIHPPTNYFPLLVPECLLIEPTENETKETLDRFVVVMEQIREEMMTEPEKLTEAPLTLPWRRLDEARAARQLNVCCAVNPEVDPERTKDEG